MLSLGIRRRVTKFDSCFLPNDSAYRGAVTMVQTCSQPRRRHDKCLQFWRRCGWISPPAERMLTISLNADLSFRPTETDRPMQTISAPASAGSRMPLYEMFHPRSVV